MNNELTNIKKGGQMMSGGRIIYEYILTKIIKQQKIKSIKKQTNHYNKIENLPIIDKQQLIIYLQ